MYLLNSILFCLSMPNITLVFGFIFLISPIIVSLHRYLNHLEDILDKLLLKDFVLSNDTTTATFSDKITAINVNMFLE